MTVPLLPDSAPFTPAQRAYLNGFFAGLLSIDPATVTGEPQNGPIAAAAPPPADMVDEDNLPWHDPSLTIDRRMELATDKPVEFKLMAAMAQLDCGACGYLCRTYSKAIADGAETDLGRCVPGGKDTQKKLRQLLNESPAPVKLSVSGQSGGPSNGEAAGEPIAYERDNPFPAPVLAVKRLTKEGSAKDVRFVALDLTGSGITYSVGDALGVYPDNCPEQVDRVLAAMGATGNEPVAVAKSTLVPLREALLRHRTITAADDTLTLVMAEAATEGGQEKALRELATDDARLSRLDLLDLLLEHPLARPKPPDLIAALPKLQPRLYSISSSQSVVPNEVHLTVGVVRYELEGRPRRGVASTFFADRVAMGDTARVFVHKAHAFTPPPDPTTPMVMVGPGTGIAPFRAFLQHRQAAGATGRNWLLFGDQHRETDYLYEHEIARWCGDGLLSRVDLAFSRDQDQKLYVQHRMIEHGAELWRWLAEGAHFYVCGDAKRMAKDVDAALVRLVAEHGGMSEQDARSHVDAMAKAGRYQRDVY